MAKVGDDVNVKYPAVGSYPSATTFHSGPRPQPAGGPRGVDGPQGGPVVAQTGDAYTGARAASPAPAPGSAKADYSYFARPDKS
jgi:hypothetical protein